MRRAERDADARWCQNFEKNIRCYGKRARKGETRKKMKCGNEQLWFKNGNLR